jgi:hypothetical protein
MSKIKVENKIEENPGFYKGYKIEWLRNEPEHPDFYLVDEFDKKAKKKGVNK